MQSTVSKPPRASSTCSCLRCVAPAPARRRVSPGSRLRRGFAGCRSQTVLCVPDEILRASCPRAASPRSPRRRAGRRPRPPRALDRRASLRHPHPRSAAPRACTTASAPVEAISSAARNNALRQRWARPAAISMRHGTTEHRQRRAPATPHAAATRPPLTTAPSRSPPRPSPRSARGQRWPALRPASRGTPAPTEYPRAPQHRRGGRLLRIPVGTAGTLKRRAVFFSFRACRSPRAPPATDTGRSRGRCPETPTEERPLPSLRPHPSVAGTAPSRETLFATAATRKSIGGRSLPAGGRHSGSARGKAPRPGGRDYEPEAPADGAGHARRSGDPSFAEMLQSAPSQARAKRTRADEKGRG